MTRGGGLMRRQTWLTRARSLTVLGLLLTPSLLAAQATSPRPVVIGAEEGHTSVSSMGVETVWKVGSISTGASQVTLATGTLPPGHETAMHLHEIDEEVIYVLSGELTVTLEGEEHTVGPGATVFIPPESWMAIANRTEAPVVMVAVISRGEAEECFRVLFSRDADEAARRDATELCRIRLR
jgi:quercetin dioxygenase-like cupin family protein